MASPVEQLAELLRRAGARVTLDMERSTALKCYFCGTMDAPRRLFEVGTWLEDGPGNQRRGDPIERPCCVQCATRHSLTA